MAALASKADIAACLSVVKDGDEQLEFLAQRMATLEMMYRDTAERARRIEAKSRADAKELRELRWYKATYAPATLVLSLIGASRQIQELKADKAKLISQSRKRAAAPRNNVPITQAVPSASTATPAATPAAAAAASALEAAPAIPLPAASVRNPATGIPQAPPRKPLISIPLTPAATSSPNIPIQASQSATTAPVALNPAARPPRAPAATTTSRTLPAAAATGRTAAAAAAATSSKTTGTTRSAAKSAPQSQGGKIFDISSSSPNDKGRATKYRKTDGEPIELSSSSSPQGKGNTNKRITKGDESSSEKEGDDDADSTPVSGKRKRALRKPAPPPVRKQLRGQQQLDFLNKG